MALSQYRHGDRLRELAWPACGAMTAPDAAAGVVIAATVVGIAATVVGIAMAGVDHAAATAICASCGPGTAPGHRTVGFHAAVAGQPAGATMPARCACGNGTCGVALAGCTAGGHAATRSSAAAARTASAAAAAADSMPDGSCACDCATSDGATAVSPPTVAWDFLLLLWRRSSAACCFADKAVFEFLLGEFLLATSASPSWVLLPAEAWPPPSPTWAGVDTQSSPTLRPPFSSLPWGFLAADFRFFRPNSSMSSSSEFHSL
mmetsp:Transcript_57307/g.159502  ORF Transcript_57307/g.159502 Transcript_57307/m.159502 type:complete len:262 (-) Transcript_57307:280-1065(-)